LKDKEHLDQSKKFEDAKLQIVGWKLSSKN